MYFIYCLTLFLFVYTLPSLAVFPRLVLTPKLIYAVPIISAGIVYLVVTLLQWLGWYHAHTVLLLSCITLVVACYRLYHLEKKWQWHPYDKAVWLFIVCLVLPYFFKLGTESFERGDEIYSWNFWALQHLYGETLDFSHTSATYPQLFPKLLSFCYMLLGDVQLQCPVKAMLGMFSLAMIGAWASVLMPFTPKKIVLFCLGVLYVVAGLKLEQFFNDGYADPIMSASLVVSVALLLQATLIKTTDWPKQLLVGLAVFCGFVACATKQPAFLWLCLILPLYLTYEGIKLKQATYIGYALASVGLALVWFMTEGSQFYNNQGVVYLSFEGRGYLEQFFHVFNRYMIQNPLLLIFFIVSGWWATKHSRTAIIFYAFVLPSTLLWLMFGAYQLRLGQHAISVTALISFYYLSQCDLPKIFNWATRWIQAYPQRILASLIALCVVACCGLTIKSYYFEKPYLDLKQGGRVSLERYFKQDAQKVYDNIYLNQEALLWVPTRYIYGIFYSHTKLTTPDYHRYQPYTQAAIVQELRQKLPDYVFTVSEEVIDGPASRTLAEVIEACPDSFEVFAKPPNKFNYTTYKVDKGHLVEDLCLTNIETIG